MTTVITSGRDARTQAGCELPEEDRAELAAALERFADPSEDIDSALAELYSLFARLPSPMLRAILDFARYADSPGMMLVGNLPVDREVPPTPTDGGPSRLKRSFVSEACLLGLSQLLGEPIGFTTEKQGRVVHDVVPVESGRFTQSNQGSSVFLEFHTDTVYDDSGRFNATNPDFLVLLCVREDHKRQALTYYADARSICAAFDDEDLALLREPLFRMHAPSTYCREFAGGSEVLSDPVPIISGPSHLPEICIAANGVRPLTPDASRAFARLEAACRRDDVAQAIHLMPGEAMLVNNRKGVHARSEFAARFDGTDRWLQRTYVRRSLWEIRHRCTGNGRVYV